MFYVNFNVNGESAPRTARIRANSAANPGDDLTIDYQYKLTYTVPSVGGTAGSAQEVFFYKRDGASINLPVLSDSVYTNQGGIDYHANKWLWLYEFFHNKLLLFLYQFGKILKDFTIRLEANLVTNAQWLHV